MQRSILIAGLAICAGYVVYASMAPAGISEQAADLASLCGLGLLAWGLHWGAARAGRRS